MKFADATVAGDDFPTIPGCPWGIASKVEVCLVVPGGAEEWMTARIIGISLPTVKQPLWVVTVRITQRGEYKGAVFRTLPVRVREVQ